MVKRVGVQENLYLDCMSKFFFDENIPMETFFDSQAKLFIALYNMVNELSLFTVQMNFGASFFRSANKSCESMGTSMVMQ